MDQLTASKNKLATNMLMTIMLILDAAYALETFVKHERSIGYFGMMIAFTAALIISTRIIMSTKPDSPYIKWIIGAIYFGLYAIMIMTSGTALDFCYAIPYVLVLVVFADLKYNLVWDALIMLMNIIYIVSQIAKGHTATAEVQEYEIQVAVITVSCIYASMVTMHFKKTAQNMVSEVNESKEEIEKQSDLIKDTVAKLSAGITEVVGMLDDLQDKTSKAKESAVDVNTGISDCADAITRQLKETEEIQQEITTVSGSTDNISENLDITNKIIVENNKIVKDLVTEGEKASEVGHIVKEALDELNEQAASMEHILTIISSISGRTNLLALNASIEAARAGEAGRGFSVVANEISNLSKQTQDATKNISDKLSAINEQVEKVIDATDKLLLNNRNELSGINTTSESFEKISENSRQIDDAAAQLKNVISGLAEANQAIVESSTNVSALSEEVTAQSSVINEYMTDNLNTVSKVVSKVQEIDRLSKSLV